MIAYGPHAMLVACEDHQHAQAVRRALLDQDQWRAVRAGVETVVVEFDASTTLAEAERRIEEALVTATQTFSRQRHHLITVTYDGQDLTDVATQAGLTVAEVIDAHTRPTYTVATVGFAPGFGYLLGGDPRLVVPRRATPRTRVPAGSVALAEDATSIYPSPSPGGWNLLGHTETVLFDPTDLSRPSLLAAGDTVRFEVAR